MLHITHKYRTHSSVSSSHVTLEQVQASNASIKQTYPDGLVAVFAGATAGIGEASLREFVRHTTKPRAYIIGRSQEACDRLDAELKALNPEGQYHFIRSDISLLRNVDKVCREICSKETAINILFMSQGGLYFNKRTYILICMNHIRENIGNNTEHQPLQGRRKVSITSSASPTLAVSAWRPIYSPSYKTPPPPPPTTAVSAASSPPSPVHTKAKSGRQTGKAKRRYPSEQHRAISPP